MEELQFLKKILDQVGFPVFVAIFLLVRTDKKLEKIVELQHELIDLLYKKKD